MKTGKVSETVLKRSVFKQLKTSRKEVLVKAGVGEDCSAVQLEPGEAVVMSVDPITGTVEDIGELSVYITVNDLASSGAEPIGILMSILLPPESEEKELRELMQKAEAVCSTLNIQILGGHTEVTTAVTRPVVTVTGVGKVKTEKFVKTSGAIPGQDIVVSKWIGIEGTSIIAKEKEAELLKRFPASFVEQAKRFDEYILILDEAATAMKSGVSAMHDVTEGGIFGALWEIAEASGVGLDIDMKKIPVRQETIELCEVFDLNPYMLISSGCLIMVADNGLDLVTALEREGIKGTVIGKVTEGNDRLIRNGEDFRYLERPRTDELYKIYETQAEE